VKLQFHCPFAGRERLKKLEAIIEDSWFFFPPPPHPPPFYSKSKTFTSSVILNNILKNFANCVCLAASSPRPE